MIVVVLEYNYMRKIFFRHLVAILSRVTIKINLMKTFQFKL